MSNDTELATARRVASAIAEHYGISSTDFFPASHEHEGLPTGSASVAWEGGVENWATEWRDTDSARTLADELGIWFEPGACWRLDIHPREQAKLPNIPPRVRQPIGLLDATQQELNAVGAVTKSVAEKLQALQVVEKAHVTVDHVDILLCEGTYLRVEVQVLR